MVRKATLGATVLALAMLFVGSTAHRDAGAAAKPASGPVDTVMGLYEGMLKPAKGEPVKIEADVIGEGNRAYRAVVRTKGDEWKVLLEMKGRLPNRFLSLLGWKKLHLTGKANGVEWTGTLCKGKLLAKGKGGSLEAQRIGPHSPSEAAKPPSGAIILLSYEPGKPTSLDEWTNKNWKILPDGSVEVVKGSSLSRRQFGDIQLHVEFKLPYMPTQRGQGRANSGVYLQNQYEVQVLDSFGLPPKNNECAGLYTIATPKANACYPPLCWQTYDITFHAPRFKSDGTVEKVASITAVQNGVTVHDNVDLPRDTEHRKGFKPVKVGPIELQDHGNPIRYRNIWVVELKGEGK